MGLRDDGISETPPRSPSLSLDDDENYPDDENHPEDDDMEYTEVDDQVLLEMMAEDEENIELSPPVVDFTKHTDEVLNCDFHPSEANIVATTGCDDQLYVWKFADHVPHVLLNAPFTESVDYVKFSPNGQFIAAGDLAGHVKIVDTSNWTIHFSQDFDDQLEKLFWHPSFPVLIVVLQMQVVMINVLTKDTKAVAWSTNGHFALGDFLPDGKRIVLTTSKDEISVVDLKTASVVTSSREKNPYSVSCLGVSRDGAVVLCGCAKGEIFSFAIESAKITVYPVGLRGDDSVEEIAYAKAEAFKFLAASINLNGVISFWDTSKQTLRCQCISGSSCTKMVWHPTEPILFTSHGSGAALMVDGRTGDLMREYQTHRTAIMGLGLSCDASYLLACGENTARVFKVEKEDGNMEN